MNRPSEVLRMVEVSGTEALRLLESSTPGRLVYAQRGQTLVRPARHVWVYGRLIVRAPVRETVVPDSVTYQVDEIRGVPGTGWTVTVTGPAEVITDPDEATRHRRTLAAWTHGPHDTVLRVHPKTVTGFRLTGAER